MGSRVHRRRGAADERLGLRRGRKLEHHLRRWGFVAFLRQAHPRRAVFGIACLDEDALERRRPEPTRAESVESLGARVGEGGVVRHAHRGEHGPKHPRRGVGRVGGAGGTCRGSECPWRGRRSRPRARRDGAPRARRDVETSDACHFRRGGRGRRRDERRGRGDDDAAVSAARVAARRRASCREVGVREEGARAAGGTRPDGVREARRVEPRRERSAVDVDSVPLRRSSPTTAARGERLAGADERAGGGGGGGGGGGVDASVCRARGDARDERRVRMRRRVRARPNVPRRGSAAGEAILVGHPRKGGDNLPRWRVSVAHLGRVHRTF